MFNTKNGGNDTEPAELEIDKAREAFTQQIRKTNREDTITKRRNLNSDIDKFAYQSAQSQRLIVGNEELSDRIDE
jgi:hypothetical protein